MVMRFTIFQQIGKTSFFTTQFDNTTTTHCCFNKYCFYLSLKYEYEKSNYFGLCNFCCYGL